MSIFLYLFICPFDLFDSSRPVYTFEKAESSLTNKIDEKDAEIAYLKVQLAAKA